MVKTSAPGKLYLFGEHAVMYGAPSIVTAIDKRMSVEITKRDDNKIVIDVLGKQVELNNFEGEIEKEFRFVVSAVKNFFEKFGVKSGLNIKTSAEFDSKKSFGSSAAVTTAVLKALDYLFDKKMLKRELFDLGFKAHSLDVQKTGSGFDIAASTYGGTLYFEYAGKKIEKIEIDEVPILYANLPSKFDTPEMVRGVKVNAEKYPELYKQYIETIKTIVNSARKAIEEKNWKTLGELMSANQGILESIGVNTEDSLVACHIAKRCGAWGAKMTGGGGDNIIILADPSNKEKIKQELEKKFPDCFIDIKANASGVRIDES